MSRTYRKYPTYQYTRHGIIYNDIDDIPKSPTSLMVDEEIKEYYYEMEYEYRTCYDKKGVPILNEYYRKLVKVKHVRWVNTGKMIPMKYWFRVNYEMITNYNDKSREGLRGNNRVWLSHGVGSENKRIRKKKHRAEARHVINRWMQGDFDCDIPIEKNHDRWDAW